MFPEILEIENKRFNFVRQSRRGEVAVYNSGELYARIGEKSVIEKMMALHHKFATFGFPVPSILSEGQIKEGAYFLEQSFGPHCFSLLFRADIKQHGLISARLFGKFLAVTEDFAHAQLRSAAVGSSREAFTKLVGPDDLVEEMPRFGKKILRQYDESLSMLDAFPAVLTHGDLNPHNLFPAGMIDFEKTYYGPVGYDLVTNIFHANWFPKSSEYEYFSLYSFTDEQEKLYYDMVDRIYIKAGLPKISDYKQHFEFFRAIWSTARNHQAPKLQQWRYELFENKYMH